MKELCGTVARSVAVLFSAGVLTLGSELAAAQGWDFWKNSPFANMEEEDMESFKAEIRKALDEAPDTEVIEWSAPSGERKGKILSKFTYQSHGTTCRRLALQLSEGDRKQNHRFDMCQDEGRWEVVPQAVNFTESEREQLKQFLQTVMNEQDSGIPIAWTGSDSKTTVVVVPLEPVGQQDSCRQSAININGEGPQQLSGQYRFCRDETGEWHYRPN